MPMTSLPVFLYPEAPSAADGALSIGSFGAAMNASGDRCGWVVKIPKTGTLDSFEFGISNVSNNPDNGIRLSFQDVSTATGLPDTVQDQFKDITGTISAGWQVASGALTNDGTGGGTKRSVTAGDLVALVVDFVNFVASDSFDVSSAIACTGDRASYSVDATNGVYAKGSQGYPLIALKYSDGTYADLGWAGPFITSTNSSFASNSTPDERGNVFVAPMAFNAFGMWYRGTLSGDVTANLYAGTTLVASGTVDKDQVVSNATNGMHRIIFTAAVSLVTGGTYRLTIAPSTTTAATLQEFTVPATGAGLAATPGGATMMLTTRTDAGAFTDTSTQKACMGLLCNGVTAGGGRKTYLLGD